MKHPLQFYIFLFWTSSHISQSTSLSFLALKVLSQAFKKQLFWNKFTDFFQGDHEEPQVSQLVSMIIDVVKKGGCLQTH